MKRSSWNIAEVGISNTGPAMWAVMRGEERVAVVESVPEYGLDFDPAGEPTVVGFSFRLIWCTHPVGDYGCFRSYSLTKLLHSIIGWVARLEDPVLAALSAERDHLHNRALAGDHTAATQAFEVERRFREIVREHADSHELIRQAFAHAR